MFITKILYLFILHTSLKSVYAIDALVNGSKELRQPRVTGRIVKIYSGSKSEPIQCEGEGFQGDPVDCSVFYRCIEGNNGKYTIFRFQCGPGTIYDPETEICNHPKNTKRSECNNISERKSLATTGFENEIENEALDELPAPINRQTINLQPSHVLNGNRSTSSALPSWLVTEKLTEATTKGPVKVFRQFPDKPQPQQSGKPCASSGFMGDDQDCRKFYRCVANERGGYIRYEFSCSETTIWDDDTQSCNHPWSTKRSLCSSIQDSDADNSNKQEQIDNKDYGNKVPILSMSPEKLSTTYLPSKIQHVPLPEPVTTSNKNEQIEKQNQYSDQEDSDDSPPLNIGSNTEGTKCTKSGFMGDSRDCRKFYRCVDNGMGSYTRYEFACGDGTVWDASIDACNHAWAVKGCGGSSHSEDSSTTTTRPPSSTTQQTTTMEDVDDGGYGGNSNQDSESSSSAQTEKPLQSTHAGSTGSQCKSSGFMGDANDCKKFYRCVDDGNGGYTKYEFSCGEGTVWDQSIEGCNHAWAVDKCGGSTQEYHKEETTTPSSVTQTQITQSDNVDVGYGEQQDETKPETTTQKDQSVGAQATECQSSGFLGDKSDCKKFYRCVDNGNGGFIKYEFTCGEGTVWDQEIQACNHPTKGGCRKGSSESHTEASHDGNQETTKSPDKTTTEATQNTSQRPSSSTESSSDDSCVAEGFYANSNDCKKFYRCVSNGNGGFTKYDFSCGEGTVWVQEIQACDHDNDISTCKNQNNKPSESQPEDNDDPGYQTPASQSEATTTSENPQPDGQQQTTQSTTASDEKCTNEGFFANLNDCTKFYRCVDNGNGGLTKYDFSCGDGTAWDQNLQTCTHKNEVASCKQTSQPIDPESEENPYQDISNPDTNDSDSNQTPQQSQSSSESSHENGQTSEESNSSGICTSEGFFPNANDCTKFYRCVSNENGGFTKYDFTCGEGTAWDQNLQTCNYKNQVPSCNSTSSTQPSNTDNAETGDSDTGYNQETPGGESDTGSNQEKPGADADTGYNQETPGGDSDETSPPDPDSSRGSCQSEGFFPNPDDCTKFYRCVSNGNGGYTKYDFTCGEGTAWDQNLQTCNYISQVPNCNQTNSSQGESSTSQTSTTTESVAQTSSTTASSNQNSSNCTQNQTGKPSNANITCPKEGFYANPNDCKKFYRCVDWDGDGQKFSVFHFECGEGTIWDPALDTCNYEDSVYPPRDCSGTQSQNENEGSTQGTTTAKQDTTTESQTEKSTTTTKQPTTKTTTTKQTTTQGTTANPTTEQTTTQKSTTTEATTTEDTTTQGTTTQSSTTASTTTQQSTSEGTTTTEGTTTQQTTTEGTTTQQSTTEGTTTQQSTTEDTTTQQSTTESTTTQKSTTESTSTTESSTTEQSTTESNSETTTESASGESEKECPETDDDQYLYVCPTGFRRHPKYCDMFYQCTEDNESHEVKVATFNCPNNTIYDESKTQCVDEEKADKKCNGQKAQKRRFKRLNLNTKQPITVSKQSHACPASGHFPFERNEECSPAFLKCEKSKSGKLRGMIYQCPSGHVYWSVSRRCEPKSKLRNCKQSTNDWSGRWEIPVEKQNVAH